MFFHKPQGASPGFAGLTGASALRLIFAMELCWHADGTRSVLLPFLQLRHTECACYFLRWPRYAENGTIVENQAFDGQLPGDQYAT